MKKRQMCYWVRRIRSGREALFDDARPNRPCQMNLETVLAHKLELDPHMMPGKLFHWLFLSYSDKLVAPQDGDEMLSFPMDFTRAR
jgi:hypothetical protein